MRRMVRQFVPRYPITVEPGYVFAAAVAVPVGWAGLFTTAIVGPRIGEFLLALSFAFSLPLVMTTAARVVAFRRFDALRRRCPKTIHVERDRTASSRS